MVYTNANRNNRHLSNQTTSPMANQHRMHRDASVEQIPKTYAAVAGTRNSNNYEGESAATENQSLNSYGVAA